MFECSFSLQELADDVPWLTLKNSPPFIDGPPADRWAMLLSKENTELKPTGTVKGYFSILQKMIESNSGTALFWIELLKRSWLKYFYPEIYASNIASDAHFDPAAIGYHPFCPPMVHVLIIKANLVRSFCAGC